MNRSIRGMRQILDWGWSALARAIAILLCGLLTSCGGIFDPIYCPACRSADKVFYAATYLAVDPDIVLVNPGEGTSAQVTLVWNHTLDNGSQQSTSNYWLDNLSVAHPSHPGVTLTPGGPCVVPPHLPDQEQLRCNPVRLVVSADAIASGVRTVTLSAQWVAYRNVIERVATFTITLPAAPSFQLSVGEPAAPDIYAVRGEIPISITRTGGLSEPVTLVFDALGSGITGTITPNPAPGDSATLRLDLPARYGAGGYPRLRVTGTAGAITAIAEFEQPINRLFGVALSQFTAQLDARAPLDIEVELQFPRGPFATNGPGRIELSIPDLPPPESGLSAVFLPDASPAASGPTPTLRRTLRLSTNGSQAQMGTLQVRAKATGLSDLATPPQSPYVEVTLTLQVAAGLSWEFVGSALSHVLTETDTVGIALQSNNFPAIVWLEGDRGSRQVYLRRFDGATFNSSPPGAANGLKAPSGAIREAGFALTRANVAKVAFTYEDGAGLAVASAASADSSWSVRSPIAFGAGLARSPRIAAGAGDALTLSYILLPDAQAVGGNLFVRRSNGAGPFDPIIGPHATGSLNRDAAGLVLHGTSALALRADGSPVVAWIEQPADRTVAPGLWLRSFAGGAWGHAVAVPWFKPLVPRSVQIVVEPAGTVVVAWLQDSPAQLMLARLDVASMVWTTLSNTTNGKGSLNIGADQDVRDVSLGIDSSGRIIAAWTEGGLSPRLWVKRQNADTTWGLLGTALGDVTTRSPRMVSDANGQLYVGHTRYYRGDDLSRLVPDTDIFVARWIFP